jgi:hypothetical protein
MLTLPERILFALAVLASIYAAYRVVDRIARTIRRGQGEIDWRLAGKRLGAVIVRLGLCSQRLKSAFGPAFSCPGCLGFHLFPAGQPGGCAAGVYSRLPLFGNGPYWQCISLCLETLQRGGVLVGMAALAVPPLYHPP